VRNAWCSTQHWTREVVASVWSQRTASAVTLLLVLGATATVVGTAGRNAGAEAAVLSRIDDRGTRSLTVYTQGEQPQFTASLVHQLARYDVVEDATAFGPVHDVTAAANPQGARLGMRTLYGTVGGHVLTPLAPVGGLQQAVANDAAFEALGMPGRRGSVRGADDGPEWLVTADAVVPDDLAGAGPTVLAIGDPSSDDRLASLSVVAHRPEDLPLVAELVAGALNDVPADRLRVQSSQELADLRAVIGGELTARSRSVILSVLAGSVSAILMIAWSLALMRRRDFGRRRALGATRTMIVALVVGQTWFLATGGALLGAAAGLALLSARAQPLPAAPFVVALITAFSVSAALASAGPAAWAACRDPLNELRVP
jgi:putative ABC transport system permease protein